jgi:hypothetical protein
LNKVQIIKENLKMLRVIEQSKIGSATIKTAYQVDGFGVITATSNLGSGAPTVNAIYPATLANIKEKFLDSYSKQCYNSDEQCKSAFVGEVKGD